MGVVLHPFIAVAPGNYSANIRPARGASRQWHLQVLRGSSVELATGYHPSGRMQVVLLERVATETTDAPRISLELSPKLQQLARLDRELRASERNALRRANDIGRLLRGLSFEEREAAR